MGGITFMNIGKFNQLLEEKFPLKEWDKKVEDERKRPIIPPGTIFKSVREMVPFAQESLLKVDGINRLPQMLKWHKSKRSMVASDTTIERSLSGFNREKIREILGETYEILNEEKISGIVLPSGKELKTGIVDGSELGGFLFSVLLIPGMVNAPVDVDLYSQGKELEASRNILNRAKDRFGEGFVDLIIGDALYRKKFLLECKQDLGCDALFMTEDKSLTIIQDAMGLFFGTEPAGDDGIERIEGVDTSRNIHYKIIAAGGFIWEDFPFELKVAYVWEEHLKPKKGRPEVEEFWVVTTRVSLSGEDMRELKHHRWEIENNVFKRLNALVKSKRRNTHKAKVKEVFLLMWFVGLILLGYYMMWRKLLGESKSKETWVLITQLLFFSLAEMYAISSG